MSEIINKFNIFRDFPLNLKQNIKSFYISKDPLLGYCVLNDNKVYGFGKRIHQILGYYKSEEKYALITELNDKNIQQFYKGYYSMFARNYKNEIFSWGGNGCGQLARGFRSKREEYLKPEKIEIFDGKNIIKVSSANYHCLALSSDGRVYKWGYNCRDQVGYANRETNCILTPIEIDFNEKIKFIHCTRFLSFAVSFDGNPYYWGRIGSGEIFSEILTPKLIAMKNVEKVYCDSRVIILDKYGKVFEFYYKTEEIIEIISEFKFNDFYPDDYLLQSEDCVYKLEDNIFIKTEFIDFFDYCSQNLGYFRKTIHLTKDRLFTKELQFNGNNLTLIDQNLFQINYDKFDYIKQLGTGAFGQVMQVKLNQQFYAIKRIVLMDELDLQEIEIMSKLKSDFVVQYIRSWIEAIPNNIQFIYIQMELSSQNLRDFIGLMTETFEENFKTFQYFISCQLFKELIECINYLHSLNPPIIHRDLKPENILISENSKNGRFLKLCDFGLAKVNEKSFHTRTVGTFQYTAPEVLNSTEYNTKSDIYSLALIATEIFRFEDNIKIIRKLKTRKDFDKYLSKYLNTNLKTKFRKLLDLISNCLLQEDYHSRPDCKQLLEKINEFFIDKNIVLNENSISLINIWQITSKIQNQNTTLKVFIENKFDSDS